MEEVLSLSSSSHNREELLSPRSLGIELLNACKNRLFLHKGGIAVIREYIRSGADLTVCDKTSNALIWACRYRQVNIVRCLLDHGVSLACTPPTGYTPLHAAADSGSDDLVDLLLTYRADPNAATVQGATPLHTAARKGFAVVVHTLIVDDSLVNTQTTDGYTPLHYAAQHGHAKAAAVLTECHADTELVDRYGRTPLHIAVWLDREEVVVVLLTAYADVTACQCGLTPLDVAEIKGHTHIAKLLRQQGASRSKGSPKVGKQLL